MDLGNFSISLAVKDLKASKAFYEKFGFKVFGGEAEQNWLIMKNGDHVIGLFQGMFMRQEGVAIASEPRTTGDGYYEAVILDPEGNRIELAE
jgi:catechol 2,3-dioxygenase-like lactoylglutathione lyase family enzyme